MRWGFGTLVFLPIVPPILLLLCFVASLLLSPLPALSLLDLPAANPWLTPPLALLQGLAWLLRKVHHFSVPCSPWD